MSAFLVLGVSGGCFNFLMHFLLKFLEANSVDPKMAQLAAPEMGLHCLHTEKQVSGLGCSKLTTSLVN